MLSALALIFIEQRRTRRGLPYKVVQIARLAHHSNIAQSLYRLWVW